MSKHNKFDTFFVFDVESVGLHGEAFSVGYVVVEDGREVDSGYLYTLPERCSGTLGSHGWVKDNLVPVMNAEVSPCVRGGMVALPDAATVRAAFWNVWRHWNGNGAILAADCPWPVEARFMIACVNDDPFGREWQGPYPLIDVASVRLAAGLDPLGTVERLEDEKPVHHPLADARQSARLLLEAFKVIDDAKPVGV